MKSRSLRRRNSKSNYRRRSHFEQLEARRVLATYLVDTPIDLATGSCVVGSGTCSIRVALDLAANSSESNRIEVPAGTYLLDSVINSGNGPLSYSSANDLVLAGTGASADRVVIDGQLEVRLLELVSTAVAPAVASVEIENLTLQKSGLGGDDGLGQESDVGGGAIHSTDFSLTLDQTVIKDNVAAGDNNAAALSSLGNGLIEISNSTIQNNFAKFNTLATVVNVSDAAELTFDRSIFLQNDGSGNPPDPLALFESSATKTTITDSVFDGNGNNGAAFHLENSSVLSRELTIRRSSFVRNVNAFSLNFGTPALVVDTSNFLIENVTVSDNDGYGGAIQFTLDKDGGSASGIIRNSTIAGNVNEIGPSGIVGAGANVSIESTIIGDQCGFITGSEPTSLGNNIDATGTCGLIQPTDMVGVDPMLEPLAENGGPVPTRALLAGSPAIDAGATGSPLTDARGVFRPIDGDRDGSAEPDIGAYEFEPVVQSLSIADAVVNESDGTVTIKVTLEDNTPGPFEVDIFTMDDSPYTNDGQTLSFSGFAGEEVDYIITLQDDSIVEEDASLLIAMDNATLDTVDSSATATLTILDDDTATLTIEDITADESDGTRQFSVSVDNAVQDGFTVNPFLIGGTATEDEDFSFDSITDLVFSGDENEVQFFEVQVIDDDLSEPTEFAEFEFIANSPLDLDVVDTDTATLTILNNDIASLTIADTTVNESDGSAVIDVSLDINIQVPFDVDVFATDRDGVRTNVGTLNFSVGGGEIQSVSLDLIDDNVVEEDVLLTISMDNVNLDGIEFSDTATLNILDDDTATLTIEDITADESDGSRQFSISVDNPVEGGFSVQPNLIGGDATEGDDFTFDSTAAIVFLGSENEVQTFTVQVVDDDQVEQVETADFEFLASAFPGAAIVDTDTATLTIVDDDIASLSIADVQASESDGNVSISVSLNKSVDSEFDVDVLATDQDGVQSTIGTLSYAGNEGETQSASFDLIDDFIVERDVTLTISLESATLDVVDTAATATLEILDDDTATLTIQDITADESDGSRQFSISVDNPVEGGFSVSPSLIGGDATLGDDFSFDALASIDFAGTENEVQFFTVSIVDDDVNELTETAEFQFNASAFPGAAIVDTDTATLTIIDDDVVDPGTAVLQVQSATADESDEVAQVAVTLVNDFEGAFTIDAFAVDQFGTVVSQETLSFTGGVGDTQTLTVTFEDDDVVEQDVQFSVELSNPSIANVDFSSTGSLTIFDDDSATLTIDDVIVGESDTTRTFTVSVDHAVQGGFSVSPFIVMSTALEGVDFAFDASTTLSFVGAANESQSFTVDILDDDEDETDETVTFGLNLVSLGGDASSSLDVDDSDTGLLTIVDDDEPIVSTGATVQGHAYCDLNANNQEEAGELIAGVQVFLDRNGDRELDAGERSTLTDASGDYQFIDVPPGEVVVVALAPASCNTIPRTPGVQREKISVGQLARAIVAVDKDGDFDQDLLVVTDRDNGLAVLRNDNGKFALESTKTVFSRPFDVAAWRPRGSSDETPTIAVAAVGGTGESGFLISGPLDQMTSRQSGSGPVDVAIGDFDEDGAPDFVTASFRTSNSFLHLSRSNTSTIIAQGRGVRGVAVGDVDGDENEDIVLVSTGYDGETSTQIELLLGNGIGGFSASRFTKTIRDFVEVRIAEIGNGGQREILALTKTGQVLVFDASLNSIGSVSVDPGATAFDVGDFNRDGKLDLAVANLGDEVIELLTGDGKGQFVEITRVLNVDAPSDLVVADFNGDGFAEIAVTNFQTKTKQSDDSFVYRIDSTVTILKLNVEEAPVVLFNETVSEVDFAFPSADPVVRLDTTGDGQVTVQDLLTVFDTMSLNAMSQRNEPQGETAAIVRGRADVNGDGVETPQDALLIINYLAEQHYKGYASQPQSEGIGFDDENDNWMRDELIDRVMADLNGRLF